MGKNTPSLFPYKSENARWIKKRGKVILLEPRKGKYYRLNETASLIWDLCDGTHDEKDIAGFIKKEFQVNDLKEVKSQVKQLIMELKSIKLIVIRRLKKFNDK